MENKKTPGLLSRDEMKAEAEKLHSLGKKIVFTNGCFDILHLGHVQYLTYARSLGDCLVLGLNSDASVKRLKGPERPIVPEDERAEMLLGLKAIDYVVLFEEDTPTNLITAIRPDILIKGADWSHNVVGREVVEEYGGKVMLAKLVEGKSTTNIIKKIEDLAKIRA